MLHWLGKTLLLGGVALLGLSVWQKDVLPPGSSANPALLQEPRPLGTKCALVAIWWSTRTTMEWLFSAAPARYAPTRAMARAKPCGWKTFKY